MLHIQCDRCGTSLTTSDGTDPDGQLQCDCCPEDHNHGEAAAATGQPCRPITITVGLANVGPAGGLN